ncbi:MAG: hypothetical protein L6R41_006168 [Letrouitia leprolyta]|nr:MAG: hypothetical protein L6R41_006168 [Letrouitia leprolyta]
MLPFSLTLLITLLASHLIPLAAAQFQFFEQMFNRGGEPQQQRPQNVASDSGWYRETYESGTAPLSFASPLPFNPFFFPFSILHSPFSPNVPPLPFHPLTSAPTLPPPSSLQLPQIDADPLIPAHCTNYLCPGTLSCVHFPHHCPCAWPAVEDKIELGEGSMVCVSKGGWAKGEAGRKVELARKGLL